MIPFLHTIEDWAGTLRGNFGVRLHSWVLFILGLVLLFMSFVFMPSVVSLALSMALFIAPVWLPLLLIGGALKIRLILKQSEFIASQKYILLEIKPPRNLVKTPLAMEVFLSAMHFSPGESNWYVRWLGRMRPWWSLEMASIEGQIHFFIWTRANYRRIIESQMYAQYPGVQIIEAPDYTRLISAKPEEWGIWGCDFKQSKPDPLPIKTYVEYGLDKVQKEPEQIDPLANLIEFLASAGKGENIWLQFVIRVHKGEKYHKGVHVIDPATKKEVLKFPKDWKEHAAILVAEIRQKTRDPYVDPTSGKEVPGFPNPTKGQMEKIAAIERNVSKLAFDVGMRCVYIARPEKFNPIMITHMISLFKPFNTEGWNDINSAAWLKNFDDYPWEFRAEKLKDRYRRELVQAFRRRQFFFDPFSYGISPEDIAVMSTEELATVYHIPSLAVETPSLGRVNSATGEAPANLPV
ncbi:MAG: hypothetical protein NTV60_02500 [Candidatus Kaiserbacteria bacterium]|nr:hypothetical protein [Candidatus Kaiserbacteria bacterium]